MVLKEELMLYKLDVNKAESKSKIYRFTMCEQAGLFFKRRSSPNLGPLSSALRKGGYER